MVTQRLLTTSAVTIVNSRTAVQQAVAPGGNRRDGATPCRDL
ncbi:MAG: hypothetical protein ABI382_00270 [Nakamurella sp.]